MATRAVTKRPSASTPVLALLLLALTVVGLAGCGQSEEDRRRSVLAAEADLGELDTVPQYGGQLNVGNIYVTLKALSWDPGDWNWKLNHDAGMFYEQLLVADLQKATRNGGPHDFRADAWIPPDALRGEVAESWEWEDDLTLVFHLRKGVQFPAKTGVMEQRELTAEDIVFSFNYIDASPKKIPTYREFVRKVSARDRYTVVFELNWYNSEWDYRLGYGYYSAAMPRELADHDKKDWRNMVGTGPFQLDDVIDGNSQTYVKNPIYWDSTNVAGKSYKLPFVDQMKYRTIKDEATYITALRTGQLDIVEGMRWIVVDHLKKTTPELKWARWRGFAGIFIALRVDQKPFDDLRVRQALNLAIDLEEIVEQYYGGHAEQFNYPQHPDFLGYFEPLEEMPEEVQELFTHNPEKARRLLAEAGYEDGFSFKMQVCSCDVDKMDLAPLLAEYLAEIGVEMIIEPLEYGAHLSMMTTKSHGPGYFLESGHVSPTSSLRKNFGTGQLWNPSLYSNPEFDRRMDAVFRERDEETRKAEVKALTRMVLAEAPYIYLPSPYAHTAWWPWVKNYNAEIRAGAVRPGPIYARIWIDQKLKSEMGF